MNSTPDLFSEVEQPLPAGASPQPRPAPTLLQGRMTGQLKPLDKQRIRAQLAFADDRSPSDLRRALALVLQRLADYYQVIQYTGPGYVFGKSDSEWPSAQLSSPQWDRCNSRWYHEEASINHSTVGAKMLFDEAGWMCLTTAARIAAFEIESEVPEASELLRKVRSSIQSMLHKPDLSGVRWEDARRRLGTPGIRKLLARLTLELPRTQIGISREGNPVVLSVRDQGFAQVWSDIPAWSYPVEVEKVAV